MGSIIRFCSAALFWALVSKHITCWCAGKDGSMFASPCDFTFSAPCRWVPGLDCFALLLWPSSFASGRAGFGGSANGLLQVGSELKDWHALDSPTNHLLEAKRPDVFIWGNISVITSCPRCLSLATTSVTSLTGSSSSHTSCVWRVTVKSDEMKGDWGWNYGRVQINCTFCGILNAPAVRQLFSYWGGFPAWCLVCFLCLCGRYTKTWQHKELAQVFPTLPDSKIQIMDGGSTIPLARIWDDLKKIPGCHGFKALFLNRANTG